MPDLYQRGDYDLAGFVVGVAEKKRIITGQAISPGDKLIGVASSGLHSNGYSLARKIAFEIGGFKIEQTLPELGTTVAKALLAPTKIYAKTVRGILNHYQKKNVVHGIAHITGGGLHENLERIIPPGCRAIIDRASWPVPAVFQWLQKVGEVEQSEMDQVFNMGIGLVLVVSPHFVESIQQQLSDLGEQHWLLGEIVAGEHGVAWKA